MFWLNWNTLRYSWYLLYILKFIHSSAYCFETILSEMQQMMCILKCYRIDTLANENSMWKPSEASWFLQMYNSRKTVEFFLQPHFNDQKMFTQRPQLKNVRDVRIRILKHDIKQNWNYA